MRPEPRGSIREKPMRELAAPSGISLPGAMNTSWVLQDAGLVSCRRRGCENLCGRLVRVPFEVLEHRFRTAGSLLGENKPLAIPLLRRSSPWPA